MYIKQYYNIQIIANKFPHQDNLFERCLMIAREQAPQNALYVSYTIDEYADRYEFNFMFMEPGN